MVGEAEDGMRLDQYTQNFLGSFSREAVKKKILEGEIRIFGRPHPHKPSTKVYHKEQVEIVTYNLGGELEEEPRIIYEDQMVLITTKPPFMATHPTGKHLFKCLTVFYEEKYGHTIHSIHRLDLETSGVQIMGKSPEGAHLITPMFEEEKVKKAYFFISKKYRSPFPMNDVFEAREPMGQEDNFIPRLYTHCYPEGSSEGKRAKTNFIIFHREDDYALGLAFPQTGRQHQIRAHAAYHGYPLLGDKLYNGDVHIFTRFQDGEQTEEDQEIMEINRQALHALALKLPYPNNKMTVFRAPLPLDLSNFINKNLNISADEVQKMIELKLKDWR